MARSELYALTSPSINRFLKFYLLILLSVPSDVITDVIGIWLVWSGWPQKFGTLYLYATTLPNINRFSKLFHCQNQERIYNNTVTKDPMTPHVCRYATL